MPFLNWPGVTPSFAKHAGHVRLIGEAAGRGNLLQSQLLAPKEVLCPLDPLLDDKGVSGAAKRTPQLPIEGPDTHPEELGHALERYGVLKFRIDKLFQPGDLPSRQAAPSAGVLKTQDAYPLRSCTASWTASAST